MIESIFLSIIVYLCSGFFVAYYFDSISHDGKNFDNWQNVLAYTVAFTPIINSFYVLYVLIAKYNKKRHDSSSQRLSFKKRMIKTLKILKVE